MHSAAGCTVPHGDRGFPDGRTRSPFRIPTGQQRVLKQLSACTHMPGDTRIHSSRYVMTDRLLPHRAQPEGRGAEAAPARVADRRAGSARYRYRPSLSVPQQRTVGATIPGLRGPFSPESEVRTVFTCFGDLGWDRFRRCNAGGRRSEPGAGSIPAAAGGPRPRPEPPPVSRRSRSTVGSHLRAAALLAAIPRGGIAALGTCPETAGHLVPPPQRTAPSSGGAPAGCRVPPCHSYRSAALPRGAAEPGARDARRAPG